MHVSPAPSGSSVATASEDKNIPAPKLLLFPPGGIIPWSLMEQQGSQNPKRLDRGSSSSAFSTPQNEGSRFAFVLDQKQAGSRNHAMRIHWNERHRVRKEKKRQQDSRRQLPVIASKDRSSSQHSGSSSGQQDGTNPITASMEVDSSEEQSARIHPAGMEQPKLLGLPGQVLTGVNHALTSTRLDPFDVFPIRLTSQHHKLIHHCTVYLVAKWS